MEYMNMEYMEYIEQMEYIEYMFIGLLLVCMSYA